MKVKIGSGKKKNEKIKKTKNERLKKLKVS